MPVALRFASGAEFESDGARRSARSLIRRYAGRRGALLANEVPDAVRLRLLGGGRSAARVYRVTPFSGGTRPAGAPVVVKILPRGEGLRERANYQRHVRTGLPAGCYPELLGFGLTVRHAALWYPCIARPDGSRADTLTDRLRRVDMVSLDAVIASLLACTRRTWHGPGSLRRRLDLSKRYLSHYFGASRPVRHAEQMLQDCASRYFRARNAPAQCVIRDLIFPSPQATLFASGTKRRYLSGVIHGDLNSDNILFDDRAGRVALIDFQKTGRGHVFEDFVALEASVRINFPGNAGNQDIFDAERRIALGSSSRHDDAYSRAIRRIRRAARIEFSHAESFANYHYAVAAIGLRLMHATDLTHAARARIVAGTLWASKILGGVPSR